MSKQPLLQLNGICKSFKSGPNTLQVLDSVDLTCHETELLAVMGPSGCGKTTLLNCISGLDRVDSGSLLFQGNDLVGQSATEWDQFRSSHLGMVFQFNQLLPEFTALENTLMPGLISQNDHGGNMAALKTHAQELLDKLGLKERMDHRPAQLSGGEQQRVAIARSLMNRPNLILADEPTGSLDHEAGIRVFELLKKLQAEYGFACILVTHNRELARMCDRIKSLTRSLKSADDGQTTQET